MPAAPPSNPRSFRGLGAWQAAAWAGLLVACGSTGTVPVGRLGEAVVIPAGGSSFYRFGASEIELLEATGPRGASAPVEATFPKIPADAGRPAAGGVDRETAWAAVAYERKLAVVELSRGNVRWFDAPWSEAPYSVAVTGGLAAAVSGDKVAIFSLRDGLCLQQEDLAAWLERFGLEVLSYALPLSRTDFLLVGFKPMGLISQPQAMVQRIDLSGIETEASNIAVLPDLMQVQACAWVGSALYVAGVREEDHRLPGRPLQPGDLQQTLIVYRVEPKGLAQKAVVRMERHALGTHVTDMAIGDKGLSLVLDGEELLVFELGPSVASQPVDRAQVEPGTSATWLEGNRLALIGPKGYEVVTTRVPAE